MPKSVHIRKRAGGWAVMREGSTRASSVHGTQAEAVGAARRLALKSGGAEVVTHAADGTIRRSDSIGATALDEHKRSTNEPSVPPPPRAPRTEGQRTTLRVPEALSKTAGELAAELGISTNDALLRLASRGAALYERERLIAARRAERWAAVVPGMVDIDITDFPSPDEARQAVLGAADEAASDASRPRAARRRRG